MKRNILKSLLLINILFLTINNVSAYNIYESHFKYVNNTVIELFISDLSDEDNFASDFAIISFCNDSIDFNYNNILKELLLSHQQIYDTGIKVTTLLFINCFNHTLFNPSKHKNLSPSDSDYLHLV